MGRQARASETGQVQAEYALVVGALAVGCIIVALFFAGALSGVFDSSAKPLTPGSGTFTPPGAPAQTYPTTIAECKNDGWKDFPQFTSEAECIDYVDSVSP